MDELELFLEKHFDDIIKYIKFGNNDPYHILKCLGINKPSDTEQWGMIAFLTRKNEELDIFEHDYTEIKGRPWSRWTYVNKPNKESKTSESE